MSFVVAGVPSLPRHATVGLPPTALLGMPSWFVFIASTSKHMYQYHPWPIRVDNCVGYLNSSPGCSFSWRGFIACLMKLCTLLPPVSKSFAGEAHSIQPLIFDCEDPSHEAGCWTKGLFKFS